MAQIAIPGGGAGGIDPDELTAAASDVLSGKTAGVKGSDEPVVGTMPNNTTTTSNGSVPGISSNYPNVPTREGTALQMTTDTNGTSRISICPPQGYYQGSGGSYINRPSSDFGNATAGYVYSGKTFTSTAGVKVSGTMTVGSILSFSAAAYSGRQILLKWQNPYAASGKPFSGVFINYSTSGYPGTGGTRIYTGAGSNTASGGWSQAIVTMPGFNTTYYFSCNAYCTCSAGEMWGNTINASAKTSAELWLTYTSGATYTIPAGYSNLGIFAVGGGGKGRGGMRKSSGSGGGGGGYTTTKTGISISSGQALSIVVGAGSTSTSSAGGTSSVTRSGTVLCSAAGGSSSNSSTGAKGGSGGAGGQSASGNGKTGLSGGTNGGNGSSGSSSGGTGQGTTTRSWGSSSGTLYAGGGGSSASTYNTVGGGGSYASGGSGGSGGGGNGAAGSYNGTNGGAGSANTGGGGGGGGCYVSSSGSSSGGNGGSGIVLLHLY